MEKFVGNYKLDTAENFEAFMAALGVGFATRKIGNTVKPTLDITYEGGKMKFSQKSTFKNTVTEFELDKEFETNTVDGRKVKTIFSFANGTLHQKEIALKAELPDSTYDRVINANGDLEVTCNCKGVVCKRTYKRL